MIKKKKTKSQKTKFEAPKKSFKRFLKYKMIFQCGAVVLGGVLIKQFCYAQTDGFALYKICSNFAYHPEWDVKAPSAKEMDQLMVAMDQPFHYLAKGAQSYVFSSHDGRYVIKFFRVHHLRPPLWLSALTMPYPLMPYKIQKMISKDEELEKDFMSYKIAYEEMKEETGLVYLHLNKTAFLNKKIQIIDKIGIKHEVELDQMEFLIQKKANLVYPSIQAMMETEGLDSSKEIITGLVELLVSRCEKGIYDKDPDLNTNFGYIGKLPFQIDVGRFRKMQEQSDPEVYYSDLLRITDNLHQWLQAKYPLLAEHLKEQLELYREKK